MELDDGLEVVHRLGEMVCQGLASIECRLAQKGEDGIDLAEGPRSGSGSNHVKWLKASLVVVHSRGGRAADLVGSRTEEDNVEDKESIRVAHFESVDEGIDDDNWDTLEEEE